MDLSPGRLRGTGAGERLDHFGSAAAHADVGIFAGDAGDLAEDFGERQLLNDPQRGNAMQRVGVGEHSLEALLGGVEVEGGEGLDGVGAFAIVP